MTSGGNNYSYFREKQLNKVRAVSAVKAISSVPPVVSGVKAPLVKSRVCISVSLWYIRIFGYLFLKSGYLDVSLKYFTLFYICVAKRRTNRWFRSGSPTAHWSYGPIVLRENFRNGTHR